MMTKQKTVQLGALRPAWSEEEPGRKLSRAEAAARTRERILQESMRLFASESYDGVSMRDIAGEIGIKSSSIYNYYESKEELLREILTRFEQSAARRFARVSRAAREATSLGRFLDLLFEQFCGSDDLALCYGAVILLKEQFAVPLAGEMVMRAIHKEGVDSLQAQLEELVRRELLAPCNTRMAATTFIHCSLVGAGLRMHELLGHPVPVSSQRLYENLKDFLCSALQKGI